MSSSFPSGTWRRQEKLFCLIRPLITDVINGQDQWAMKVSVDVGALTSVSALEAPPSNAGGRNRLTNPFVDVRSKEGILCLVESFRYLSGDFDCVTCTNERQSRWTPRACNMEMFNDYIFRLSLIELPTSGEV